MAIPSALIAFLQGGNMVALLGIALFFLRYWKETSDRLFAYFSGAFLLMALCQLAVFFIGDKGDYAPHAYWVRLLAFLLIIVAIVEKNSPRKRDR